MSDNRNTPACEVHDLKVSYDKKPVLWGIDFKIPRGVLVGIVGPNGSGKTTLLNSILGLKSVDRGYSRVFGEEISQMRKRVSYVPQRDTVDWDFPATVFEVVLMGRYGQLGLFKRPGKMDRQIAMESLEKVGMQEFRGRQISELSGGQQQRVFIARSLAQQADCFFLDEPFAGVDASSEASIIALMKEMVKEGKTLIVVHHDLNSVQNYFEWLILLNLRMVAAGPTKEVFTEENLSKTYGGQLTILSRVAEATGRNPQDS
jgi:manganese/zinc/iron transport system ATP- binding protein